MRAKTNSRVSLRPFARYVYATRALYQTYDGPGQIIIDHDEAVLQVLTLGKNVRGDQHTQFVFELYLLTAVVAHRAEPPCQFGGIGILSRCHCQPRNPPRCQLLAQIARRIRELREYQRLIVGAIFRQQFTQCGQLAVMIRFPDGAFRQDFQERLAVGVEIEGQLRIE